MYVESWMKVKEGTSPDRVKMSLKCQKDWQAEYDMLLPDSRTCSNCVHCKRCCTLFGSNETDTSCQFYPSKWYEKTEK